MSSTRCALVFIFLPGISIFPPRCLHTQFTIRSYTAVQNAREKLVPEKEKKMNRSIVFKIVAGLVLVAALAGIAFFAFTTGAAYGATLDLQKPLLDPGNPVHPYYGYGLHPYGFRSLGCFGLLIPLFLLFLAFGAFRRLFWGPRWGWHMYPGAWNQGWGEGVPPMFTEWHRRAHTEADKAPEENSK
jgi:hypothetical protein